MAFARFYRQPSRPEPEAAPVEEPVGQAEVTTTEPHEESGGLSEKSLEAIITKVGKSHRGAKPLVDFVDLRVRLHRFLIDKINLRMIDKEYYDELMEARDAGRDEPPIPALSDEMIAATSKLYGDLYERMTGKDF